MNTYIVQYRMTHKSRLETAGTYKARTTTGAFRQALEGFRGEDPVEFVATIEPKESACTTG